jgi:hypothetical protein
MREVWLRPNRRALLIAQVVPLSALAIGIVLAVTLWGTSFAAGLAGVVLAVLGALGWLGLLRLLFLPRLARQDDFLLVYLRQGTPYRVPLEIVEVFFAGQGPSLMPRQVGHAAEATSETSTVVVRLAESAPEWHQRSVSRSLGTWCEGYITIRGTWCEPLGRDVFQRLNQRLVEVHRERKSRQAGAAASDAQSEGKI